MDLIKRNLHWLMSLIAVMALGVSVTACSDDDDDEAGGGNESSLVGYWECPNGDYYYFDLDGSGEHDDVYFDKYRIRNGWLEIYYGGDWDQKGVITFGKGSFTLDSYGDGEYVRTYHKYDDDDY